MRRQEYNKRRPNVDNRSMKNAVNLLGMQPGLFGNQSRYMGGGQDGILGQGNLSLIGNQASLLGSQSGLMRQSVGMMGNQMGMLDNPGMMGVSGQDLLNNITNPNILGMLANRNVNSLIGAQLNGSGTNFSGLQSSLNMGLNTGQCDSMSSLLGDPLGGSDMRRSGDFMSSSSSQAGILGPPPDSRRVMPLLCSDDMNLGIGIRNNSISRKRPYEEDLQQISQRYPPVLGGQSMGSNRSVTSKNVCELCNWSYSTTYMVHCQSSDHKKRIRLVNKGCILCATGKFKSYPDYVNHLDSARHKQKKDELNRQKTEQAKAEKKKDDIVFKSEKISESAQKPCKSKNEKDSSDVRFQIEDETKLKEVEVGEYDIFTKVDSMVYDPNVAVGQDQVMSVTGYYCKLCRKFYNNENQAKVFHCKTEAHFEKYRDALRLK